MHTLSLRVLLLIVLVFLIVGLASQWLQDLFLPDPPPQQLTIQEIQSLSALVTARVQVADVLLVDQNGLTGGMHVAAVIKGDYLIEVDLAQARFEKLDPVHRTAVLDLPEPKVLDPRVNLERSRLFALRSSGLWAIVPGDSGYTELVNQTYRKAQRRIASASTDASALVQARLRPRRFYEDSVRRLAGRSACGGTTLRQPRPHRSRKQPTDH